MLFRSFYFDAQGKIRRIPSFTDSRFGTYLIRERSEGHFQLLGTEKNGQIRYGSELYLSPGVVTVEVDDSMP